MRWKIRNRKNWKEEAVSPVIATILMVAITVVLAAVLYLLVSGIIDIDGDEPKINLSEGTHEKTGWIVRVSVATEVYSLNNYEVTILKESSIAIEATDLDDVKSSGASQGDLNLTFYDATNDDKLNAGDWFVLSGMDTVSDYQVKIHWKASGNEVSGDTGHIKQ